MAIGKKSDSYFIIYFLGTKTLVPCPASALPRACLGAFGARGAKKFWYRVSIFEYSFKECRKNEEKKPKIIEIIIDLSPFQVGQKVHRQNYLKKMLKE